MSRMDRYESSKNLERTEKNKKLYETVTDIDVDYIDVNNATVIKKNYDNAKLTRSEYHQRKEIDKLIKTSKEEQEEEPKEEIVNNRVYDINEILKLARENKLFESDDKKRLINTEYNILTKLDISKIEEKDTSKENLRELIDTIYGNDKPKKTEKVNTGGLLDDLMVDEPVLSEETSKDILDKEETTDKEEIKIDEVDTSDTEEINNETAKEEQEEPQEEDDFLDEDISRSRKTLIFIIILVILILSAVVYLFYKYFL